MIYQAPQGAPRGTLPAGRVSVVPPEGRIEALYELARVGNMKDILDWANQVVVQDERYRPLTDELCALTSSVRGLTLRHRL
jgi:hypothetical protein